MTALILLAGGQGTRMGTDTPKVFLPLEGKPLALHAYATLAPLVDTVVVVCPPVYQMFDGALYALPGERRQDSVASGFAALPPCDKVLIHDAARPYIRREEALALLAETGPAALATPVVSTIKETDGAGIVQKTHRRENLWAVQTPQLLPYALLKKALGTVTDTVTDDVAFAEALGVPVKLIPGHPSNVKITYPSDLCATL